MGGGGGWWWVVVGVGGRRRRSRCFPDSFNAFSMCFNLKRASRSDAKTGFPKMAISLERSSLFGSPFRAHFWPIFGPILGSILVRFAVLGPDPAITTGAPFSTRKHEDFADMFNKIPEFYRAKRPSISVLSRRNRPPCTCLKKYRKHMVFARIAARMCKNQ